MLDVILDEMLSMTKEYDLVGVEMTYDDAVWVIERMQNGNVSREQALRERLSDIRDVLDAGLEAAEEARDYDDSFFGNIDDED